MKILTIFGTRPEAIKMAPIIEKLKTIEGVSSRICITAQHRSMLDSVMQLFGMKADYDLNVMRPSQSLNFITSEILKGLQEVLFDSKPDLVLVQGDTTTTFAGALASFYEKIPIGHIEAGLRTRNKSMPWPEETNRSLTTLLADFHFAPTEKSKQNLLEEKVLAEKIFVTGNTVIDALFLALNHLEKNPLLTPKEFGFLDPRKKLILVTGHRRENFGPGFEAICKSLKKIAENEEVQIVYPVHLNPNVQKPVKEVLGSLKNVHLIEPLDYLSFVYLMNLSFLILTDSGGIQEEAPSLGKPVLVLREVTERPEALDAGTVLLVGTDEEKIVRETFRLLNDPLHYGKMSQAHNPYGDGKASEKILQTLLRGSAICV